MSSATHISLCLARFDSLRRIEASHAEPTIDALFYGIGADTRAAGRDPDSREAFKFLVLGLHPSGEAAERVLSMASQLAPWLSEATETWSAVLEPFRHYGESNHLDRNEPGPLFERVGSPPSADEPMVAITSAGFRRGADFDPTRAAVFSEGVMAVRASMTAVDGLHTQQSFSFSGEREIDGVTVTTWSSFDAMRAWAYGSGSHRLYLDRHRKEMLSDRTSFSRCRILHSNGTWHATAPDRRERAVFHGIVSGPPGKEGDGG